MAGRHVRRTPLRERLPGRATWQLVACLPLLLLLLGLGIRAADWPGGDGADQASAVARPDDRPRVGVSREKSGQASRAESRRTTEAQGPLTPREARARCTRQGIDRGDLGAMSECIAQLVR